MMLFTVTNTTVPHIGTLRGLMELRV